MAAQLAVAFLALLSSSAFLAVSGQKFNAIFSFGDSMSDTGNLCVNGPPAGLTLTQPPYGETFFGRATCRCSDGRLVVDFLAEKFGLPLLKPSKQGGSDFKQGANMAIIGATTMDSGFFQSLGIADKIWNNGLQVVPVQVPVRAGRVRRQRLQRADLRRLHPGAGERAERHHRGRHRQGRGAAHQPGRHVRGGPGRAARGVLPDLPDAVPDLQRRRLRPVRLPEALQRAVGAAQLAAAGQGVEPAEQVPRRAGHVRRLLQPRVRHGEEPRQLRVQHQPQGLLRRRRRQVQLPERRAVRHARRVRVL
ncbi:Zea nodulation homolog1 [Zea mays]|uniref:Zea nodulation homolog1 n=1 Tax=Zea mays TaxID=4577 RepID=A0A1D6NV49_MAIZE|nr:Zea nodulation homolog1 [Zea mays]